MKVKLKDYAEYLVNRDPISTLCSPTQSWIFGAAEKFGITINQSSVLYTKVGSMIEQEFTEGNSTPQHQWDDKSSMASSVPEQYVYWKWRHNVY